ncbi:GntR family transcriptional regulator [Quadrisphaera sp. KR29]|uniref:GntR family transcriptional regulator n=1 Tax=Quadrisphaera sp. KR29 TaxID=3461391 RepID=UPI0040450152
MSGPAGPGAGAGAGPGPGDLVIVVDTTSAVPPYEQVRSQVAAHVVAGRLAPGDRLPTVRALAADLGIAVGTVARAYRELEAGGHVLSRRRTGTVVAPVAGRGPARAAHGAPVGPGSAAAAAGTERVRAAAVEVARVGREAGWDDEQVLAAVRGALLADGAAGRPAAPRAAGTAREPVRSS